MRSPTPQEIKQCYERSVKILRSSRSNTHAKLTAIRSLRVCAKWGHTGAQFELGAAYKLGVGVRRNKFLALRWMLLAAAQGDADAAIQTVLIADGLRPEQVVRAYEMARREVTRWG